MAVIWAVVTACNCLALALAPEVKPAMTSDDRAANVSTLRAAICLSVIAPSRSVVSDGACAAVNAPTCAALMAVIWSVVKPAAWSPDKAEICAAEKAAIWLVLPSAVLLLNMAICSALNLVIWPGVTLPVAITVVRERAALGEPATTCTPLESTVKALICVAVSALICASPMPWMISSSKLLTWAALKL